MDEGKNVNPVWSPDGRSLAFVSDRTGISNLYLYDLNENAVYQLTDVFTGVSGITPISPALSWARQADRLAFAYYENGEYNVYSVDNPRSLRHQPYQDRPAPGPVMLLAAGAAKRDTTSLASQHRDSAPPASTTAASTVQGASDGAVSVYRPPSGGFRPSSGAPEPGDSVNVGPPPVSVRTLLDSASLSLPDTTEFSVRPYSVRFTPDYTARPTIGYARDNFGRGFFGGAAVSLSDMLGDHTLQFAGAVNGRISEAQIFAAYINQRNRMNWGVGGSQTPYYFFLPSTQTLQVDSAGDSAAVLSLNLQRYVVRDLFAESYYPFSRFSRIEVGVHGVDLDIATLSFNDYYVANSGANYGSYLFSTATTTHHSSLAYVQPSLALVHDNAIFGYVGPFAGGRSRFGISPAFGSKQFTTYTADYRRYLFARPFTLAVRGLFYGNSGRDANLFPIYLGSTELIRGYTSGSIFNHECATAPSVNPQSVTQCDALDRLIGTRIAVANVELRFPLTRSLVLGFLPVGLPPIEGALFYDAGVAWNSGDQLHWRSSATDARDVKGLLRSYGGAIRVNLLGFVILRFDVTKPLDRVYNKAYWTVSLGPTF
jgi:surface antigen Omp85-like protein/WD40 repeat protein